MKITVVQDPLSASPENSPRSHVEVAGLIAAELKSQGHDTFIQTVNAELTADLEEIQPDLAFNIASRTTTMGGLAEGPAVLEALGIPFTGSSAAACTLAYDKTESKFTFESNNVPIPKYAVIENLEDAKIPGGLAFPLFIKPVFGGCSRGIIPSSLVPDKASFTENLNRVSSQCSTPLLVEEFITGREFSVGILGFPDPVTLPILEIIYPDANGEKGFRDFSTKMFHSGQQSRTCPADIPANLAKTIRNTAMQAFSALGCRDYARVDLRLSRDNQPMVLEVNALPSLFPETSSFIRMAQAAGIGFSDLISQLINFARNRARI